MATATIVTGTAGHPNPSLSPDGLTVYCAFSVNDGPPRGTVEYIVSTDRNTADGTPKTLSQLRADLTAALKALRDGQLGGGPAGAGVLSGTVTV